MERNGTELNRATWPPTPNKSATKPGTSPAFSGSCEPARKLAAEALALEHEVSNEAYGLTPEEIRLLWDTAPPRMPIPRPVAG